MNENESSDVEGAQCLEEATCDVAIEPGTQAGIETDHAVANAIGLAGCTFADSTFKYRPSKDADMKSFRPSSDLSDALAAVAGVDHITIERGPQRTKPLVIDSMPRDPLEICRAILALTAN